MTEDDIIGQVTHIQPIAKGTGVHIRHHALAAPRTMKIWTQITQIDTDFAVLCALCGELIFRTANI